MGTTNLWNASIFEYQKESAVSVTNDATMQQVCQLVTSNLPAGTYYISYSFEVDFNSTKNTPAYFALSGTYADAEEFAVIASGDAAADNINRSYGFPKYWDGGVMTITLNMRRDSVTNFDCDFVDVMVERKA